LVLDDQTPTSNFSKQNLRKSSQKGLLKTEKRQVEMKLEFNN